jgi:hypothetical protein
VAHDEDDMPSEYPYHRQPKPSIQSKSPLLALVNMALVGSALANISSSDLVTHIIEETGKAHGFGELQRS